MNDKASVAILTNSGEPPIIISTDTQGTILPGVVVTAVYIVEGSQAKGYSAFRLMVHNVLELLAGSDDDDGCELSVGGIIPGDHPVIVVHVLARSIWCVRELAAWNGVWYPGANPEIISFGATGKIETLTELRNSYR